MMRFKITSYFPSFRGHECYSANLKKTWVVIFLILLRNKETVGQHPQLDTVPTTLPVFQDGQFPCWVTLTLTDKTFILKLVLVMSSGVATNKSCTQLSR